MSLATGAVLRGRFVIREVIGTGGMGAVFRAHDRVLDEEVAVKSVRDASPQAFYRLKAEFRSLADVRHRNLVRLGELYGDAHMWFFTMERVDGQSFLSWVRRGHLPPERPRRATPTDPMEGSETIPDAEPPRFDERRLRAALGQLASGLGALHRAGLVHRDVKPSNVMVETRSGRVVILDFGLARVEGERSSASGSRIAGTVEFMAPEVANEAAFGPASDWYGVGVMLYEALTGRLPYEGQPLEVLAQKVNVDPEPPSTFTRDIPPDLEAACMALLRRDPARRADSTILRGVSGSGEVRSGSVRLPADDSPFVGRERELAALRKAFDDSRRGRPVMVRLVGESGLGKTALARRFAEELDESAMGVVLLHGRCYAHELVPYKAWDGVVDEITRVLRRIESSESPAQAAWLLPEDVHALARVFPALRRVTAVSGLVPPTEADQPPERLRRRAFDALRELLRNLGRDGPVVVWIDDFHWADRDSRLLLEDLVTSSASPPLLILVTARPEATSHSAVPARRITVSALSERDTQKLATELLEAERRDPPEGLDDVVRESAGHPMFLQQLLHEAHRGGGPTRLDDIIRDRVSRLEPAARRVLEVVCVSGVPLGLDAVCAATTLDAATCRRFADTLEAERLLRLEPDDDSLSPYHDRIRESVIEALEPDQRARRHAALAAALAPTDSQDVDRDVVRHLAEAGQREEAAAAAEIAAIRAERSLAFDRASELYRMALSLGRHAPERRRALRLALSTALANAGHGALEAAQGFLSAADAEADEETALSLRTRALEQLAMSGHTEQALELLRALCSDVGVSLPRTRFGALVSLARRRLQLRWIGLPDDLPPFEGTTVAESPTQQLYLAAFMHLPIIDPLLANELHARILADALRGDDLEMLGFCLCREVGIVLTFNERRFAHTERVMRLARKVLGHSEQPDHRAWLQVGEGLRSYFGGQFEIALSAFRTAQEIWSAEAQSYVMNISQLSVFTMGCLRYVGDLNELRRELEVARREADWRGNRYLWTLGTVAFGLPILLQDGLAASRRDLERVDMQASITHSGANRWYLARGRAEEALYRGADLLELAEHIEALEGFLRTQYAFVLTWSAELRWLLGRLWLAAFDAGDARGTRKAHKYARNLLGRRLPYARVWGRALLAAVHVQRGEPTATREALEECAVRGELNGFALIAEAARVRLGQLGLGGEDAYREALAFFDTQRIADLDATLRLFMPGFGSAPALPGTPPRLPGRR